MSKTNTITFQFEAYATRENINEAELTIGLKKKIKDIRTVAASIPDLKRDAAVPGLSDKKKAQLELRIEEYEAALPGMDEEIIAGIKKWQTNKGRYAEAGKRLRDANTAKRAAVANPAPAPTAATSAPAGDPPAPPAAPTPEPPATPSTTPANQDLPPTEKKKMGPLGWALIALGAVVLGVGGVALARRASERAGL